MATLTSDPETLNLVPNSPTPDAAATTTVTATTPPPPPSTSSTPSHPITTPTPSPNPNPNPTIVAPPLPQFPPSFRPVGAPQFSPVVAPTFQSSAFPSAASQNPTLPPPGVAFPVPGAASGPGVVTVSGPPIHHQTAYYPAPGQPPSMPPRPYWHVPNGYVAPHPGQAPGMVLPPPGIHRYPAPYPPVARPGFPPRPMMPMNVIPTISRPPIPNVGGAPVVPSMMRPVVPIIAPAEKPQTTVYVGKIASTVENSFLLSLLEVCGSVKSWKPAQNPSDGSLRGFGFCEFELAEGVLRALRLLSKLNLDGQELVLNVNQATREYLERYVVKETEKEKLKEVESDSTIKENDTSSKAKQENEKKEEPNGDAANSSEVKEKQIDIHKFGIVTEEDRENDRKALEKLKSMIGERLKAKPLPPPPPVNVDGSTKVNSEISTRSRNGDAEVSTLKRADDHKDEDKASDNKAMSESDKLEGSSLDKARRRERSRERDREREKEHELKREKERELERYERDRERERVRRDRERDLKMREAERKYRDRLKDWEAREREKEHQRHYEREKEKERDSKRRREVMDQEDESDDDDVRKRRRRSGTIEDRRKRRQREKEDDLADRLKEEEEIAEAREREAKEQELKQKLMAESEISPVHMLNENGEADMEGDKKDVHENTSAEEVNGCDVASADINGDILKQTVTNEEAISLSETKLSNISSRKLGFGIVASGKRSIIPSIFNEEDEEDSEDKKMRPFIPIDYTEDLEEAAQTTSETPPNLVAAAEYAKRISGGNQKDEKPFLDKDRNRRSSDWHRDKIQNDDNYKYMRDGNKDLVRERNIERERDNKKLLDAKQLIDTIPKTKEELFSYNINWAVYDKHHLHERMRPWITKKITDFLGEEETSLVDYIVSSTNNHVKASDMLELLQSILDEEAEMFVLKMWRMLIFEIKKVETGLVKSKT